MGSILPGLVPHRQAVELFPQVLPMRWVQVHQCCKPLVVGWLDQVHPLMHQDVLEALGRFLGQVGVESDVARPRRTSASGRANAVRA